MHNKIIRNIDSYVFDNAAKILLANSFIISRFGYREEIKDYASPEILAPWLRGQIEKDRTIYPEALTIFPDNKFWNRVFNIETIECGKGYRESAETTFSFSARGINLPDPTSAQDCAALYLNNIFSPDDIILDIGSGEGSFLNYTGILPFRELIGVETRKNLYNLSLDNINNNSLLDPRTKINIYYGDVREREDLFCRATSFYIFNSVKQPLLKQILTVINESIADNPRKIKIVYCNPEHWRTLSNQKWLKRSGVSLNNGKIAVWENKE